MGINMLILDVVDKLLPFQAYDSLNTAEVIPDHRALNTCKCDPKTKIKEKSRNLTINNNFSR